MVVPMGQEAQFGKMPNTDTGGNTIIRAHYAEPVRIPHQRTDREDLIMAANSIHVSPDGATTWLVQPGWQRESFGSYRSRRSAVAFASALAFRRRVDMIIHELDGRIVRHLSASLTYPILLK